ncbi:MFS transporter [Chloroflexota bacterium]
MKLKMFYGWYIVGASVIISAIMGGMSFYGFTALVNPVSEALGWSFSQISLVMSIRGLEVGILSPFLGKLVDRWQAKWLILAGAIIIALGYIVLSRVNSLAMFYISFMIIALGSSLGVTMAPMVTTARWFKKNLGKATGIIAVGVGVGGLTTPIITKLIDTFDWRVTVIILAAVVAVIGIPLAFVFRNRPEEYGMLPDGVPQSTEDGVSEFGQYDFDMGVREAIKMRAFWHFGLASFCQVAAASAVILHVMPYLVSLGITRTTASMVAMFVPMASIPARLTYGWLADIFPKKYVFATANVLTGIGLFCFSIIGGDSSVIIVLFVVFFGFGLGGLLPIRAPIIREYFGTKNFGTIFGITFVFLTLGTIISPPIAGWVYDVRGVYDPYWLILGGIAMVAAVSMLTMPLPLRRTASIHSQ